MSSGLLVLGQIDAVVDDVNALRVHFRISSQNVGLGALRNGDDRVRIQNRRALHPRTHRVARCPAAPPSMRAAVPANAWSARTACRRAFSPGIRPSTRTTYACARRRCLSSALICVRFRLKASSAPLNLPSVPLLISRPWLRAAHVQFALVRVLRTPAMHLDLDLLGQFAAQVIHVDARAAVHLRRIFACKQSRLATVFLRSSSISLATLSARRLQTAPIRFQAHA